MIYFSCRFMVPVLWYGFSAPISGSCVMGIIPVIRQPQRCIYIYLESRRTVAVIETNEVNTAGSVATRLRPALIHILGTVAALKPRTTLTAMRLTDISARPAIEADHIHANTCSTIASHSDDNPKTSHHHHAYLQLLTLMVDNSKKN